MAALPTRAPLLFLRAKLDVQAGPTGLWMDVDWQHSDDAFFCRFEVPIAGSVRRLDVGLSRRELARDDHDVFLRFAAEDMAGVIQRESGVATRILVRENRAAWEWHEDHKHDPPQDRPCSGPLPRRRREAGQFCGTCRARFRTEDLAERGYSDGFGERLPCGHMAAGVFEEDV